MQQIGQIAKNHVHVYKNNKGEEQHLKINSIPNNMEKYMAFMLGDHLAFINSFQFMSSSLDKLASNLPKEVFKYTSVEFKGNNNKKRSHTQLDSRKQVIAFQDRVITMNIKEAQHPLK